MQENTTVLIDLNIILDVFLKWAPFFEDSYKVFNLCVSKKIKGVIAAHSITNLWYVLRKQYSDEKCREIVLTLLDSFTISSLDTEKIKCAVQRNNFSDFKDCIQDECAINHNASFIITRDKKDFINSKIPSLLPTEFLSVG